MTQPGEALREALRANLFDGDEGGTVTMPIAQLLTDIVDIIEEHALAAPVAGGLDVERLARAAYEERPPTGSRPVPWTPVKRREWTAWARRIALAAPVAGGLREAATELIVVLDDTYPEGETHLSILEAIAALRAALAAPVAGGLDEERLGLLRALSLTHHIFDLPIGEDVTYSRGYSAGIGAAREVFREAIYAALAASQPVAEERKPFRPGALEAWNEGVRAKYERDHPFAVGGSVGPLPPGLVVGETGPEGLDDLARSVLDHRNPPPGHFAFREPEMTGSEWRAAYFVLARIALEQLDKCWAALAASQPVAEEGE